ncbi:SOS response-associated peptidase [Pseudomonas aeruginosa]|uniref:SOS response-associated peptidase n=1 Tax=Pseudomonas aeruginosa TaxID=287 RepID=UPI001CD5B43F|nr:SOS response-associated peptidase family protein [Pseudomonas aeruginosa]HCF3639703.1 SOS response-associated peptidase family protein [Pseudomonas aeruginosa]HCF4487700.1 SOS response-associated peptidase family protein [Pseudomonas aeruginosa]HCF5930388.1 SOS response-associated peptidase family protein [Pseudomonas aeruginosa]HCF6034011.1 SOS response-associated peptidase family protein [Pseudomonas aeruginosa]HCL3630485.1 SOS response-associated peptidase family protein [Pseudomonas aer
MCGRLSQYTGLHEFVDALSMPNVLVNLVGEQPERYNVAPSTQVTTLRLEGDALVAQAIRWGWRPFWARDRAAPINARAEKVATSRFYNSAWRHRALCPVSGWFEWVAEGGPRKQPFHIQHRDGSPILCAAIGQFPGIDDEQDERHGFVIITADSAGGMVDIHDRRPVVLSPDLAREWLDPATPPERAEQIVLNQGEPSESFTWYAVDPAVGNVRNQGPQLIAHQRSAS